MNSYWLDKRAGEGVGGDRGLRGEGCWLLNLSAGDLGYVLFTFFMYFVWAFNVFWPTANG